MSATHDVLRIIELVTARLCQDFDRAEAKVHGAASLAPTRLRLAAWEASRATIQLAEIAALAKGLPGDIGLDVSSLEPTTVFPPATGRVVLNLLLLAADSLPSGGAIVLAGDPGDLFVQISSAASSAWPVGLALCMADAAAAQAALADIKSLQMAITTLLAHAAGLRLSLVISPVRQDQPAILRLGGS